VDAQDIVRLRKELEHQERFIEIVSDGIVHLENIIEKMDRLKRIVQTERDSARVILGKLMGPD